MIPVLQVLLDTLFQSVGSAENVAIITAVGFIAAALLTAIAAVVNSAYARSSARTARKQTADMRTAQEQDAEYFRQELERERHSMNILQGRYSRLEARYNDLNGRVKVLELHIDTLNEAISMEEPEVASRIRRNAAKKRSDAQGSAAADGGA